MNGNVCNVHEKEMQERIGPHHHHHRRHRRLAYIVNRRIRSSGVNRRQCQNQTKMEFMINRINTKPENDEHLSNAKQAHASRIIHFTVMRLKRPTTTTAATKESCVRKMN